MEIKKQKKDFLEPALMGKVEPKNGLHYRKRVIQRYKQEMENVKIHSMEEISAPIDIRMVDCLCQLSFNEAGVVRVSSCCECKQLSPIDYSITKSFDVGEAASINNGKSEDSSPGTSKCTIVAEPMECTTNEINIEPANPNVPSCSKVNHGAVMLQDLINRLSGRVPAETKCHQGIKSPPETSDEEIEEHVNIFLTLTFSGEKKPKMLCDNQNIHKIFLKSDPDKRTRERVIQNVEIEDKGDKETFDISSLNLIKSELNKDIMAEYKKFKDQEWETSGKKILVSNPNMRRTNRTRVTNDPVYLEKRKRNNEAAKRSRDLKRLRAWEDSTRLKFLTLKNDALRQLITSNTLYSFLELTGGTIQRV